MPACGTRLWEDPLGSGGEPPLLPLSPDQPVSCCRRWPGRLSGSSHADVVACAVRDPQDLDSASVRIKAVPQSQACVSIERTRPLGGLKVCGCLDFRC